MRLVAEVHRLHKIGRLIPLLEMFSAHEEIARDVMEMAYYGARETLKGNVELFNRVVSDPDAPEFLKIAPVQRPKEVVPSKPTWIYLMRCEKTGLTKIGRSKNPQFREKTFQSESPSIVLTHKWMGRIDDETELHSRYADLRKRGEWFELNQGHISEIRTYMEGGAK